MPSVSTSQSFDIAYVLDEQCLRQLDDLLKEFSPQIEYELECSDSSTFNYDSVEPIIKFANPLCQNGCNNSVPKFRVECGAEKRTKQDVSIKWQVPAN
jgi:hypothetical protein